MSDYINTSLQPPSGARLSWDAMDNPAPSSFAAPTWLDCVCGSKPTIRSETGVYIAECNGMGCTVPMIMALSSEQLRHNWNAWMERAQSNSVLGQPCKKP